MNIVITGASRGLGFYTSLHLAKIPGNKIFALSRDEKGLSRLATKSGTEERIKQIPFDITNERSVFEAVETISKEVSGIEILINNAGLLINRPFAELELSDWQSVFNVNVFGVVNITRSLLPLLKNGVISAAGSVRSHIINISSMGGIQGSIKFKGLSAYSSSKGALITLSECLSEELKSSGVHVNTIALGSVETEMFRSAFPGLKASVYPEETAKWIAEFALTGYRFFNGKTIQVSSSTP